MDYLHYGIYTPNGNSVAHLLIEEDGHHCPALCGFNAKLGWFAEAPTIRGLGGRYRACPKCERKRPVPSEADNK